MNEQIPDPKEERQTDQPEYERGAVPDPTEGVAKRPEVRQPGEGGADVEQPGQRPEVPLPEEDPETEQPQRPQVEVPNEQPEVTPPEPDAPEIHPPHQGYRDK